MQNQYPIHCATIYAQINKNSYSGLAGLLDNVALLAIANNYGSTIDPASASYLQLCIAATSETLSSAMTALSAVLNHVVLENSACSRDEVAIYITPQLVADFAVTVGELLPVFHMISKNLNTSHAN